MGVVYLVQDPDAPRELALKLILERRASEVAVERFWREAEALARIHHRNVVRVHQIGQVPEGTYLVMERVEGETLDDVIARGALEPREAARIVRELSDAIAAVHAAGILHRDIKPGNVILQPSGIPVLLDFGLVRDHDAEKLTRTGTSLGTLSYMSPEQAGGESTAKLGPQTDVYSLGVVLYELLCGQRPFGEDSTPELVAQKLFQEVPPVTSKNPAVPRGVDAICRLALRRSPEERYASAEELREDLDRFLGGRPPQALERLPAGGRRLALGVLALLALVGLGVGLFVGLGGLRSGPAVEARAGGLVDDARQLLASEEPLAGRAGEAAALVARLAELERGRPESEPRGQRVARAWAQVRALEGLLHLLEGERAAARTALTELGEDLSPAGHALRGALAATEPEGRARRALSDLDRARAGGVACAELRGWRAQALARVGFTPAQAREVLAELERQGKGGELLPAERRLRVLALAAAKRADEAAQALTELKQPDADLRWAVGLALAERTLEEDPAAARAHLAELPAHGAASPERARLAALALEKARSLARQVESVAQRELELRLLDYCRLAKALTPDEDLPSELVDTMVTAAVRWEQGKYWSPSAAGQLAALIPNSPVHHPKLAGIARHLRTPNERKPLIGALRVAAELEPERERRREFEVGLCVALAQAELNEEALERCEAALEAAGAGTQLRFDLHAARARALRQLERYPESLAALNEAHAAGERGVWTDGSIFWERALTLLAMERYEGAVLDLAKYLATAPPMMSEDWLKKPALKLLWQHGQQDQADVVEKALRVTLDESRGARLGEVWWLRLALLELRGGDAAAAAKTLGRAAKQLKKRAAEATALAAAVEERGAEALEELEAAAARD